MGSKFSKLKSEGKAVAAKTVSPRTGRPVRRYTSTAKVKKNGGHRKGSGRKPKEVTYAALEQLCLLQVTDAEIASHFRISEAEVSNRRKEDPEFNRIIAWGQANGKISLRRKQWRLADRDSRMAIHLGKNILGQTDKNLVITDGTLVIDQKVTVELGTALVGYLDHLRDLRRASAPKDMELVGSGSTLKKTA